MSSHRQLFWMRLLSALVPLIYLAAVGAWVGLPELVARLANDDQSYYILVAKNLFERGPTYDGASLTNGVHPLFTLLLGAEYRLLPLAFSQLAAASVITCVSLGSAFLFVLLGILPSSLPARVASVALMSSMAVYPILYRGMEGALALLIIALYLGAIARRHPSLLLAGVLSTALWAARLELLAFSPLVILLAARALGLERGEQRRLWLGWLASIGAFGLYALASYCFIGLALPVSGLIKQLSVTFLPLFFALGCAFVLASVAFATQPRLRPAWITRSLLAFASVFYLSHTVGQPDIQQQTWYYFLLPAVLASAILELDGIFTSQRASVDGASSSASDRASESRVSASRVAFGGWRWGAAAGCVALALVSTVWEARFVIPLRAESWRGMAAVATRAKREARPGERFMGPGWMSLLVGPEFAPFSQDGLVGGVEQFHAIREGRALEFAYDSGVRFLFTWAPPDAAAPSLPPPWHLELISSGEIPTGRSLWASLLGAGHECGLARCTSTVSVYRLSQLGNASRAP